MHEHMYLHSMITYTYNIYLLMHADVYRSFGKFTVGYFHAKIVRSKIFHLLGYLTKIFYNEVFYGQTFVPLLMNLIQNYT